MLPPDAILREKRRLFIRSVNAGTINGLLDELLEKRVLNQEEMEKVRDENATVMDKARTLIDSVIRKGPQASQVFICHICEDDIHLAQVLGLPTGKVSGPESKVVGPCGSVPVADFSTSHGSLQTAGALCLAPGPVSVSVALARGPSPFLSVPVPLTSVAFF